MQRGQFIQTLMTGAMGMTTLSAFIQFTDGLSEQEQMMPVIFIGHGSPRNGILDNEFSQKWKQLGREIPTPKAVLVVSALWLSKGTRITAMDLPKTIDDFGGFPQELFDVQYKAPGSPKLANKIASLIQSATVEIDHDWGLDHGAWTVRGQCTCASAQHRLHERAAISL